MDLASLEDWCKWLERSVIKEIVYPIFTKIGNKEDVIFHDAEPILRR